MAPPKRKSPEKKSATRARPSIAARALRAGGAFVARHPRALVGVATFSVVFSFVAANALWYQPKRHPAPLLATRASGDDAAKTAPEPRFTTFRIERQSEDVPVSPVRPAPSDLVRKVQEGLAAKGLYDGPADGVTGPKTTAAILFFQESEGLPQTGEASEALLEKLRSRDIAVAIMPDERPSPDITASTTTGDGVADLIRAAESKPVVAIPAEKPASVSKAGDLKQEVSVETVMKIQRALTRFAYADIKVDGVVGSATRAAIRSFEKNYGLPVTGEPSERVLKKLKSIGFL